MAAAVLSPFFLALLTVFKIHFLPGLGIEGSRKYRKVQKSSFRFSGKEKRSFFLIISISLSLYNSISAIFFLKSTVSQNFYVSFTFPTFLHVFLFEGG